MKKLYVLMLVLFGMIIGTTVSGYAAQGNPCEGDIAKFCKNIEPGDGRILRCLTLSEENLTPACKQQRVRIKKAVEEVQKACADDYAISAAACCRDRDE